MFHTDPKLLGGVFIGLVAGLHYHAALSQYLPLLMVITVISVLRLVRR